MADAEVDKLAVWEKLIRVWATRLLRDPGWMIRVRWGDDLPAKVDAETDTEWVNYRMATVTIPRGAEPSRRVACHEVVHILVADLTWAGVSVAERILGKGIDASLRVGIAWVQDVEERVVEVLTRAFLAAYYTDDHSAAGMPEMDMREGDDERLVVTE